jgi:hypothetical protein
MTDLERVLIERFGEKNVRSIDVAADEMPLLEVNFEVKNQMKILITNGLSEYKMPVPEKVVGREFNEIYFCLPTYWDIRDIQNPNMNWVFPWIQRLAKHVVAKNTWFGPGHTIPCGNPFVSLSPTMRQNHFFLTDPLVLEQELTPIVLEDKVIYPLGILPIFEDEMDYKQGKGTLKLLQKLSNQGITEKLDDFRSSCLKNKWRFFKKK